jgi:hypothetical protein
MTIVIEVVIVNVARGDPRASVRIDEAVYGLKP